MLDAIGRLTWRHPRKILVAAFLFAAVAVFFGHDVEHHLKAAGFTDPDSESERAGEVLADALGYGAEPGLVVLVRAEDGEVLDTTDPAIASEVARLADALSDSAYVGQVVNPLETPVPGLIAEDGRSLVLPARLTTTDLEDEGGLADESVRERVTSDLVDVGYGGFAPGFNEVNDQTRQDLTMAELIAFPLLGILLLLVFRSVVAAAVPLILGVLSILGTLLALRVMAAFVDTSLFALNIATALSLGLAVDYALLLVSRYREEVDSHGRTAEAHLRAVRTAGRASMFSGLTVAGAMAALMLMPQRFLYSIGAAGAMVGVLSAVMAVVVVPALLVVLGPRIDALSIRKGPAVSATSDRWFRLARGVMRRPVLVAVATSVALLALAAPLLATTLTGPSAQAVPPGQQSYDVNRYVEKHHGRSLTEGVSLVVTGDPDDASLMALAADIDAVTGVDAVAPFERAGDGVAYATASLDDPALDASAQEAVHDIRALAEPDGADLLVSGNTARFIDEKESLVSNAPPVILLIIALTVGLLFLLTGSVILPLKTLLMNALTLAAVLGILVIVFEHRVGTQLLDYPGPYAVEVTSLVFLFAVTFALATDYAVLVMARIKELHDGGLSNEDAVAQGVARTGRIISAAALMIAVVFLAFAVSPVFFMKQIAVAMALGVLIDSTIVRGLLVPALMRLLGEANWWAPRPLRRIHARFGIREEAGSGG
ncbi:MMPL family transporter [Nocardioides immobilis]|uniref:MMPL family transporter n=1 Tax=Nocardioides immobilis TaxID=2049295 RepID=A0A417XZQ6_9ACTN|nr:MMPL family transporter [Nocardioides immobilis]RHW25880.1 MMPL family transporter [Nocardioides immobilis]